MKKAKFGPPLPPYLGGCSATSPLKIWDVVPHYLKTLFEQKTENLSFRPFLSGRPP